MGTNFYCGTDLAIIFVLFYEFNKQLIKKTLIHTLTVFETIDNIEI